MNSGVRGPYHALDEAATQPEAAADDPIDNRITYRSPRICHNIDTTACGFHDQVVELPLRVRVLQGSRFFDYSWGEYAAAFRPRMNRP